jgi:hypothetical protein
MGTALVLTACVDESGVSNSLNNASRFCNKEENKGIKEIYSQHVEDGLFVEVECNSGEVFMFCNSIKGKQTSWCNKRTEEVKERFNG